MSVQKTNKKYLKFILTVGLLSIGLSACSAPSVEDLIEDSALLQETMEKCTKMDASDVNDDEACQNGKRAISTMKKNMMGNILGGMNNR